MAQKDAGDRRSSALRKAIALMSEALDLVDAYVDCPDASAHMDIALRRLRERAAETSRQ